MIHFQTHISMSRPTLNFDNALVFVLFNLNASWFMKFVLILNPWRSLDAAHNPLHPKLGFSYNSRILHDTLMRLPPIAP